MMECRQTIRSDIGHVVVTASAEGVTSIAFTDQPSLQDQPNEITKEACAQLTAYFNQKLSTFSLPLNARGTEFQHKVWQALQQIPYGKTASYLDIAHAVNNPKGARAVGMANGRNPIAIVVPCHRIIGANKTLTGYAGGLDRKQFLLELEGAQKALW